MSPFPEYRQHIWDRFFEVTEGKDMPCAKRIEERKAPGPDGIPGKIVKMASGILFKTDGTDIHRMSAGRVFPRSMERGDTKEGKPKSSPSAYRPICLLGKVGKLFERIIANRVVVHMNRNADSALSPEVWIQTRQVDNRCDRKIEDGN